MNKPDDQQRAKDAAAREKTSPVKPDRELSEAELETIAAAGAAAKKPGPG
jgi:hypothetical protein